MAQSMPTRVSPSGVPRFQPGAAPRAAGTAPARARSQRPALASALGWFSIGLGLTELLAPRALARAIGMRNDPTLLRSLGLRELASGVGILLHGHHGWVKSRVAGDVIDLAVLGSAMRELRARARRREPARLAAAGAAVLGVTLLDVIVSRSSAAAPAPLRLVNSIAINVPAEELYRQLRDLERIPQLFSHIDAVRILDERRSQWIAKPLAGTKLEWNVELTAEEPGRRLSFRSIDPAALPHEATFTLSPLAEGRGTLLRLDLEYRPSGKTTEVLTKLLSEVPTVQLQNDLRRLKQWLEVGEIATTEGQPSGRRSAISRFLP